MLLNLRLLVLVIESLSASVKIRKTMRKTCAQAMVILFDSKELFELGFEMGNVVYANGVQR